MKLSGVIALLSLLLLASACAQATDFLEQVKTATAQSIQSTIDRGQDVNVKSDLGETPLMLAAESNSDPGVIIALWKAGADPNALDTFGLTPLMHAARVNPNPVIIAALLDAGADINAQINGMTALILAAQQNPNPQVIIKLLVFGADVEARDLAGNTALDYAQRNEKLTSSDACNMLEVAFQKASKAEEENSQAVSTTAQDRPKPAWPAFLLSVFVGFGTGQYYCGTDGTRFLLSDILGLAMTAVAVPASLGAHNLDEAFTLLITGPITFLVSRIWQIFDVFWAIDEARRSGRVAEVVPVVAVDIRRTSYNLGVSLKY